MVKLPKEVIPPQKKKKNAHRVPYWSLNVHVSLEEIKLGLLFILVDWHLIQKGNKISASSLLIHSFVDLVWYLEHQPLFNDSSLAVGDEHRTPLNRSTEGERKSIWAHRQVLKSISWINVTSCGRKIWLLYLAFTFKIWSSGQEVC